VRDIFLKFSDTKVGHARFESMVFRCGAYAEQILAMLARYELPDSLLAVVYAESGCDPMATSPAGAEGLWQFMPETATAYHLNILENVIDERRSPPKSTEAAIHFLADLYQRFESWDLALAAYNMGPYRLAELLQHAGDDVDFWDLREAGLLPAQASNYVPTIEAFALILANLGVLKFGAIQTVAPELTAELEAPARTRLGLVARAASTSLTRIRDLNPELQGDVVPPLPGGRFVLRVPKHALWAAKDKLQDLLISGASEDECVSPDFDWGGK
jgi:membrane-bound lytic murein transglycosylase D